MEERSRLSTKGYVWKDYFSPHDHRGHGWLLRKCDGITRRRSVFKRETPTTVDRHVEQPWKMIGGQTRGLSVYRKVEQSKG